MDSVKHSGPTPTTNKQETREFVTPYAFGVADHLLGTKLATPLQRACAQLIDLSLIALLSTADIFVLFAAITYVAFRRAKASKGKATRALLFFLALIFITATVSGFWAWFQSQTQAPPKTVQWKDGNTIDPLKCKLDKECWEKSVQEIDKKIQEAKLQQEKSQGLQEQQNQQINEKESTKSEDISAPSLTPVPDKPQENKYIPVKARPIIDWTKSILSELGLGFSWAILYFTVFTSVWQGQTPGKRITHIRVVKLDGSSLSYWESFGRYGGYGAGLATGLLGFLQVFWDANRQGIQDKIAETLVIDSRATSKKDLSNEESE